MTGEELADVVRVYLSASNEWAKQERAGICAERLRASSALLEARAALECAVGTFVPSPCTPLAKAEQPAAPRKTSTMPDQEFLDKAAIAAMQGSLNIEKAWDLNPAAIASFAWDAAEALHHERSVRAEQRSKT